MFSRELPCVSIPYAAASVVVMVVPDTLLYLEDSNCIPLDETSVVVMLFWFRGKKWM